jgi:hypothetical protein
MVPKYPSHPFIVASFEAYNAIVMFQVEILRVVTSYSAVVLHGVTTQQDLDLKFNFIIYIARCRISAGKAALKH